MAVFAGSVDGRTVDRLRAALAFAGVGAWEWDLRTGEAWWSDHLYGILGRRPNALPTTLASFLECVVEEDREPMRTALREVLQTGETRALSCRIVRPHGSIRLCRGQVGAVPDETGRCRLIMGALRDVTAEELERRQPEEALLRAFREQRTELLTMLESAPRALLLVDAAQRIIRSNRATEQLLGWRSGDLVGRGLPVLSPEPTVVLDTLLLAATARDPSAPVARLVTLAGQDGLPFSAMMTVSAAPAADGARFVVMFEARGSVAPVDGEASNATAVAPIPEAALALPTLPLSGS